MRKLLMILTLSLAGLAGAAASPDCGTPVLTNLRTLQYQTKAEFPDSPQKISKNLWEKDGTTTICQTSFIHKGNTLTIKAVNNDVFGYLTTIGRRGGEIALAGSTPGLMGQSGLRVDLTLMDVYTTYEARAMVPYEMAPKTTIGIRIDGGKLQPVYWPGKAVGPVKIPRNVKVIDIYVKSSMPTNWERVNVDLKKHVLTVYKKFAFPTK